MMMQIPLNTAALRIQHLTHETCQDPSSPNSNKSVQKYDPNNLALYWLYSERFSCFSSLQQMAFRNQKTLIRTIKNECLLLYGKPVAGIVVIKAQID